MWFAILPYVLFLKFGYGGDDLFADDLEAFHPIHAWHEADHRLYAHARELV